MQRLTVLIALFFSGFSLLISCSANKNKTAGETRPHVDTTAKENLSLFREELKGDYLIGTTVLDGSPLNMESRWVYGLSLDSFSSSECSPPASESPAAARITGIHQPNGSTLIITANIEENCSYSFLGELQIISGNRINLTYLRYGGGGFAACNCCFGLTWKIGLMKNDEYTFNKLRFVSINGHSQIKLPRLK